MVVSRNLLDYTHYFDLQEIILKNWPDFKPVFEENVRMKGYFDILASVRNVIGHSRDLVPYEADLLSGVAGHIRQMVAIYRSNDVADQHYPKIEKVSDNFGREGHLFNDSPYFPDKVRVEVGQVITFSCSAQRARDKDIRWRVSTENSMSYSRDSWPHWIASNEEDMAVITFEVTEDHVGESLRLFVDMASTSKHHRYQQIDDQRWFAYAVNPPYDA
ncbi:hypothetical protein GTQ99_00280 [Kineococcus sp. T13]|uniref:hypothetical protein n=1 Tax=Kineococcus vitellinus TaxID=2696565 RepID=UPI00141354FC|nr:hypothetical protein [Kineococcus vitellinus]NAZ73867.1 hypothetical protein [Kineococcus vitellinus]